MEGATVGLLNSKSLSRHNGLGQQNAAHEVIVGSNFAPFRVKFRSSGWNGEKAKNTSVDNIVGKGSRKSERVNASISDTRPGNRASVAVLMEVEGVLADVHRYGHRQAFNLAFQELGLDCAQWTEAIYADLMRLVGQLRFPPVNKGLSFAKSCKLSHGLWRHWLDRRAFLLDLVLTSLWMKP